jgi:predicted RNA-binding protein Jag
MDQTQMQNLIKELIEKMDIAVSEVLISQEDGSKTTWYSVIMPTPHFFTGHDGEALSALNHLVRRIVESKQSLGDEGPAILVDVGGFQKKRVENIKAVAHMMAERARYFKSSIEVDPMSAFDRRIVHEFLSEATDLKTESTGFGPSRRVVIKYIGAIS